jgi:hypothetical protein
MRRTPMLAGALVLACSLAVAAEPAVTPGSKPDDPRLAPFSPEDRVVVVREVRQARGYCQEDVSLQALFNCDRFADAVVKYRATHMSEKFPSLDPGGKLLWEPLDKVLQNPRFDCSACLDDPRTKVWAEKQSRKFLAMGTSASKVTEADLRKLADCFAQEFTTRFRAKPALTTMKDVQTETSDVCTKRVMH